MSHNIILSNDNHSYPALKAGDYPGTLDLTPDGLLWKGTQNPDNERVFIPYDHLDTTTPGVKASVNLMWWLIWLFACSPPLFLNLLAGGSADESAYDQERSSFFLMVAALIPTVLIFLTAGYFSPQDGYVSVEWRDEDLRKDCTILLRLPPSITTGEAQESAENLETAIWQAAKQYRNILRRQGMPHDQKRK